MTHISNELPKDAVLYVVTDENNPTFDYFFFSLRERPKTFFVTSPSDISDQEIADPKPCILFIRYVSNNWIQFVQKSKIDWLCFYFMDDDLLDSSLLVELPEDYKKRIREKHSLTEKTLVELPAKLLVSNSSFATKYRVHQPKTLLPSPESLLNTTKLRKLFYHGSAVRNMEMDFCFEVIREINKQGARCEFEIIGDSKINKRFRELPHTRILHPMPWKNFRHHIATSNFDIGLCPVFETGFSKERSINKIFEIIQTGAWGIYTAGSQYETTLKSHNFEYAMFEANCPKSWACRIADLITQDCFTEEDKESIRKTIHLF